MPDLRPLTPSTTGAYLLLKPACWDSESRKACGSIHLQLILESWLPAKTFCLDAELHHVNGLSTYSEFGSEYSSSVCRTTQGGDRTLDSCVYHCNYTMKAKNPKKKERTTSRSRHCRVSTFELKTELFLRSRTKLTWTWHSWVDVSDCQARTILYLFFLCVGRPPMYKRRMDLRGITPGPQPTTWLSKHSTSFITMFSKLALTIVAALVSLQGVAAAPAVPTCPSGRNAYCCTYESPRVGWWSTDRSLLGAVVFPGGDLAASCSTYTGDWWVYRCWLSARYLLIRDFSSGQVSCCVYKGRCWYSC